MRDVCLRLKEEWDNQGYSLAKMSVESGVPETTLRRVRAAESSISLETAVAVARVLGVSLDELTGLMPPPAAAVINEIQDAVREDLAEKYKPHSEHCATTCPARISMDGTIAKIEGLYRERLQEVEQLYERALTEKNLRISRFRAACFLMLGLFIVTLLFIIYLVFVDFPNPAWGIFQYPTALWESIMPQAFKL